MSPSSRRPWPWFVLAGALVVGCDDPEPHPGAYGMVGAACRSDFDCSSGFCCTTPPCGGGTCTYACREDLQCPYGSRCEGGVCFLACRSDVDCGPGQRCRHEHSVCQF